ncbi:MAG: hypothetical protein WC756_13145 [Taibaiella sp.]|jgi:hypothetical protein
MQIEEVKIEIYDKREESISIMYVQQISDNKFRMIDNDIFNCRLTLGTEFETRMNNEGRHEIIRVTKESEFVTRRFLLTTQFKESEYRLLGDEIMKQGGFWQTDFGGIATINLPKECNLDLDEMFKIFEFMPTEIKD